MPELIFANGMENLKLYYMIGLPTETDDDLVAIRDLTLQMKDAMVRHAKDRGPHRSHRRQRESPDPEAGHRLSVAADGRSGDHRSQEQTAAAAAGRHRQRVLNIKSERHRITSALSLGDRRVAPAIEAAERNGGNWRAAVAETGVDADFYIFRDRSADPCCPGTLSMAA